MKLSSALPEGRHKAAFGLNRGLELCGAREYCWVNEGLESLSVQSVIASREFSAPDLP